MCELGDGFDEFLDLRNPWLHITPFKNNEIHIISLLPGVKQPVVKPAIFLWHQTGLDKMPVKKRFYPCMFA